MPYIQGVQGYQIWHSPFCPLSTHFQSCGPIWNLHCRFHLYLSILSILIYFIQETNYKKENKYLTKKTKPIREENTKDRSKKGGRCLATVKEYIWSEMGTTWSFPLFYRSIKHIVRTQFLSSSDILREQIPSGIHRNGPILTYTLWFFTDYVRDHDKGYDQHWSYMIKEISYMSVAYTEPMKEISCSLGLSEISQVDLDFKIQTAPLGFG